jgi:site-specific DNA-methyltransferase (adenine-specific)
MVVKRKRTSTTSFGNRGRISHDSSGYYNSRLYTAKEPSFQAANGENRVPPEVADRIYCKSSEKMDEVPDESIHLMVTSPPYNASKDYDEDLPLEEYLSLLRAVFREVYRKLVHGGRACVNVANLGRKPYIPLHAYIIEIMEAIGFLMRGEIIWDKSASAGPSTAWGSWKSASNPVLRDIHEYILVFSKGTFSRTGAEKRNTIAKEDFLQWTKSIWSFPAVMAKSIGHPAPFPEELPHRLIQLYTFEGDTVLDPFCGSGSTCLACLTDVRHYIGYEINPEYADLANERIRIFRNSPAGEERRDGANL